MSDYQTTLHRLLDDDLSLKKRLTFIIDGIDHLKDFDDIVELLGSWLAVEFPPTMKVLLTLRNGHHLERLRSQLPESAFYQVQYFLLKRFKDEKDDNAKDGKVDAKQIGQLNRLD